MVKKAVKAEVNTFVKGLITEASPLNFPENASLDECNFELLRNGTRQRRLGMDYEPGYQLRGLVGVAPEELDTAKVNTFIWEAVGGNPSLNFLAVQVNSTVFFYNTDVEILSRDGYVNFVTFPSGFASGKDMSFTSVDDVLVIASGSYDLYYVTYDEGTQSFSTNTYALKTRDFWGVVDSHTNQHPYYSSGDYSAERTYNLYNQSWGIPRRREGAANREFMDPVSYYATWWSKVPSNVETVWTSLTMKADADPYEYMRPNAWGEMIGTDSVAPKGYFIIDVLKRGESRTQAVEENKTRFPEMQMGTFATLQDYTPEGAKLVKEFAGRVFYAGFSGKVVFGFDNSPVLSNYIFFSQLVKSKTDLPKCYQEGDPTSRENNEVVDTDGGFIRISGANEIIAMENVGSSLIVIASNGVWVVSGGSDYGFSATNYKVSEVSTFGCISKRSVVKTGGAVAYWGSNGIYLVEKNNIGEFEVKSITDQTIQKFYDEITYQEKTTAQGVYDDLNKTIRWLYSDSFGFTTQTEVKELILDTKLGAFYTYCITSPNTVILRSVFTAPFSTGVLTDSPVLYGATIIEAGDELVVVPYERRNPAQSGAKYLILEKYDTDPLMSFGFYNNQEFKDWGTASTVGGVDAKAYLLTGAQIGGDSSVDKQAPYLTVHMYRTENGFDSSFVPINQSGCLMRSQWGWSNSAASNKWGQMQQVYRYQHPYFASSTGDLFDTGFELITTKNKLRGMGKSVSIYFETEPGKDCKLVGWNLNINGNSIT